MVQSYKKKTICNDFSAFLLYKKDFFCLFAVFWLNLFCS